ncbi:MAG: cold-shock protein [Crocinitomicaceae bacterium]|nr:cold-shock protein [Crocinitomicaceae bacterium]
MKTGTVKFYNSEKGFGFILDDETQEDIFVHKSGIMEMIRDNDDVTFRVEQGQKGLNAVSVQRSN